MELFIEDAGASCSGIMLGIEVENERLAELQSYQILDTPSDGAFDDITLIASQLFKVPISIVSLVDKDRVWFKSSVGLKGIDQIDRGPGLCASAIMSDKVYIANDLRLDPNSLANPLVAAENGFRFYAAQPLRGKSGFNLGTFCILDLVPREFSDEDANLLGYFGRIVMAQMEHRLAARKLVTLAQTVTEQNKLLAYAANHDGLTGLLNRSSIERQLVGWEPENSEAPKTVLLLDIDRFKSINDRYGHGAGDAVLVEVAKRIARAVRPHDHVGRYGGEEFIVVLHKCKPEDAASVAERIRRSIEATPIAVGDLSPLSVTISGGLCHGNTGTPMSRMLKLADEALYAAKEAGRNRIMHFTP